MAVLVTGGAGYIGSHMVWRLLDAGEDVVVIDRLSTGFDWAVPAEAELVVGDIADAQLVEQTIRRRRVDSIIHFAGSVVVPDSMSDPLGYYLNNTVKSRALMESAVRTGLRHFIFSSTAAVYGTPAVVPVPESAPTLPESPYGTSKLMTEAMLRDASVAHDFRYTALRYFNVAGADPLLRTGQSTEGATHLIKVVSEAATGKRPFIEVFGTDYPTPDGTCVRDFIHVSDLVEIHWLALQRLRAGAPSLVANCGYGRGYSVMDVIRTVKKVTGTDFEVRMQGRREGDIVAIMAEATRARDEFGWIPKHADLETIVRHAVAWERHLARHNIAGRRSEIRRGPPPRSALAG
ncbi:MAG: UDP-glucose 4-epimerase GalE [Rhizobiaceae bacterium]|nr:UDP-glucose 4-epimerase GalE [Rhizobiaceae bacterium]